MASYLDTSEILKRLQGRVTFLVILFAIPLLLLVARLFVLQIVHHEFYAGLSRDNKLISERIAGYRGIVKDRHGITLAESRAGFSLVLLPDQFRAPRHDKIRRAEIDAVITQIAGLLEDEPENIRRFIASWKGRDRFFYQPYRRDLTWDQMSRIEEAHLPPAYADVVTDPVRDYPFGRNLSHVLGYVGEVNETELAQLREAHPGKDYRQGDWIGKAGLELTFEQDLRGQPGYRERVANARGELVEPEDLAEFGISGEYIPAQAGNSLVLTIDAELQTYAWERMLGTREGALIALDPRNGEILAMIDKPGFDPNQFSIGISGAAFSALLNDPDRPLFSRAIQGRYPPGSTYKIVTQAAALQEGVIGPHTSWLCTGKKKFGNRDFGCWKKEGHSTMAAHDAMKHSCDVYFYSAGALLGIDKLAYWSGHFGLGKPTGIELPRETAGVNPSPEWKQRTMKEPWYWGEVISSAIGQGYTLMSPLQVAKMTSVIAAGGRVFRPHLVRQVQSPTGKLIRTIPVDPEIVLPLRPEVIDTVADGMRAVVNEPGGTAYRVHSKEIVIAGKTGTAQVTTMDVQRQYKEQKLPLPYELEDHAWFTAFAPAGPYETPEIVVAALIGHGGSGSRTAAPVVADVIAEWKRLKERRQLEASAAGAGGGHR
ncbi:MAG: penicillin-binding protein 2 [Deltaproteobacteria bacterium]|nr:penicillin-binding protein 2 [Deltaproteobacteria bacterium]